MAISTIAGVGAGSSGTILTTGSPQSGGVIQAVQATSTSSFATSSTSFVTTGFSASITPKFSTSKVLAIFSGHAFENTSSQAVWVTLYRGATELSGTTNGFTGASSGAAGIIGSMAFSYTDSPATTLSTTYTVYLKVGGGTGTLNSNTGLLTLQLLEIAA